MFVKMKSKRCKLSPQRASNQQNNTRKGANIDNIFAKNQKPLSITISYDYIWLENRKRKFTVDRTTILR